MVWVWNDSETSLGSPFCGIPMSLAHAHAHVRGCLLSLCAVSVRVFEDLLYVNACGRKEAGATTPFPFPSPWALAFALALVKASSYFLSHTVSTSVAL